MLIYIYLISWIILVFIWLISIFINRKTLLLFKIEYVNFLLKKWKIVIFFIAFILLCIIADLWLDPTWDIPETIIMSILTYYTAPYSVWAIFRYIRWINKNFSEFYISIILLFFSSAWFYDLYVYLYLLWEYPLTAFSNLLLSPFFYLFAWMIWNLAYIEWKGVVFLFSETKWIHLENINNSFCKISIYLLPVILFMVVIFWYFIYLNI